MGFFNRSQTLSADEIEIIHNRIHRTLITTDAATIDMYNKFKALEAAADDIATLQAETGQDCLQLRALNNPNVHFYTNVDETGILTVVDNRQYSV